jgi:hypothetical protein
MKKILAAASLVFATAVFAEMRPGVVIAEGEILPVVADLNRDGLTDLVQDTEVLLNQGRAVFVSRPLNLGGTDAAWAALDANGDGHTDLLAVDRSSGGSSATRTYSLYLNDGQMNFGTSFPIPTDKLPYEPYVANVNGDGKDDLILIRAIFEGTKSIAADVKVAVSLGDGTFDEREPFQIPRNPIFDRADHLVTGDLDEDGHRDLLFRANGNLVVVRGTGGGHFAAPEVRYLPHHPFGYSGLSLSDIDRDGHLDAVMAGSRSVRVFFGDGDGRFTRHSFVNIPQVRQVVISTRNPEVWLANAPRGLAIGEFIARGRTEIAAAVYEGDVAFIAYENGRLSEVARTATEFQNADIFPGSFREPGKLDFYMTWNAGAGSDRQPARIYEVEPTQVAPAQVPVSRGRSRSVRAPSSPSLDMDVDVQVQAAPCIPNGMQVWTLAREGAFGVDRNGEHRLVETVMEDGVLYFRLTAPWTTVPVEGELRATTGNRYEGVVQAETTCGYFQFVNMTAFVR